MGLDDREEYRRVPKRLEGVTMEKRRIKLEINGVVCGLITEESDEYMNELAGDVGDMMRKIFAASPLVTREAAALTIALNYCDEAKKGDRQIVDLKRRNQVLDRRVQETERQIVQLKKENAQLWEETNTLLQQQDSSNGTQVETMREELERLQSELVLLRNQKQMPVQQGEEPEHMPMQNPLRPSDKDEQGYVSFFERGD